MIEDQAHNTDVSINNRSKHRVKHGENLREYNYFMKDAVTTLAEPKKSRNISSRGGSY